jgi:hypothetical protein
MSMHILFLIFFSKNMSCVSILIPLYLFNISVSLNLNIRGALPKHFLLQFKDNMFLVSKYRLTIL